MAANQKSGDFRIEDWAIPEDELPWNAPAAPVGKPTRTRFQSANVIELDQYRRQKQS
jgi:hypothetical protein